MCQKHIFKQWYIWEFFLGKENLLSMYIRIKEHFGIYVKFWKQ